MKWFRGPKNTDFRPTHEGDNYRVMACILFGMHRSLIIKLIGERRVNKVSHATYARLICETLTCLLHYIDRTLFEAAFEARDDRMDRLVVECNKIVEGYLRSMGTGPSADTPNHFLHLYEERTAEYADLDDWFMRLGLRYARHLMEALARQDYKELMKANLLVMYFMGEVTRIFPEFFK